MNVGDISDRTQTYDYNGDLTYTGTSILTEGLTSTIEDISNGKLTQIGNQIRNSKTGRIVTNLPRSGDVTIMYHPPNDTTRPEGGISILRLKEQNQFSAGPGDNAYFGASFDFKYEDNAGDVHEFSTPMVGLSKIGTRLWYREVEDGRYEYRYIINNTNYREEELLARADGFQIAPLRIAAQRSIATYLMRNYWNDLVDIIEAGVTDDEGNEIERESELAYFIAEVNMDEVSLISRSYLSLANF